MKCIRCEQEFEHPDTNVCGSCADELRQEEATLIDQAESDKIELEMNKAAYEEAQRENDRRAK